MTTIVPVILSGGSGTRLWPLSREAYPKQFLALNGGGRSLLAETARRLEGLAGLAAPLLVCNEEHRFIVAEQLRAEGVVPAAVILEPLGRNTAPAVAVAALAAQAGGEDPLLLVLPSDHAIADAEAFRAAIGRAAEAAAAGYLVSFGVVPTAPETGYGYVKATAERLPGGALSVERFVEKPDVSRAEAFVASGEYYWNSGMFVFRASRYLEELGRLRPALARQARAAFADARRDIDFLRLDREAFAACESDSIDYAVMEKTARAALVPLAVGWSDVGSWSALWELAARDTEGNCLLGDVLALDTCASYVHAESGRLVATVGVDELVVIDTADALLVAHKGRVQDVKTIVERLRREGRTEARSHRKVYRPWGAYDSIDAAERFQVKHITVKPGAALSLQMHHHRAEHWVVVRGTARVTRGDESFLLSENQSTYIPLGVTHRLENPGKLPLELIEVQSGAYLGEDDIVRFEDVYGRKDG